MCSDILNIYNIYSHLKVESIQHRLFYRIYLLKYDIFFCMYLHLLDKPICDTVVQSKIKYCRIFGIVFLF